jgi:hypothetical protein
MLKEPLAALELVTVQQAEENAELRAMLASRDSRIAELNARLSDRGSVPGPTRATTRCGRGSGRSPNPPPESVNSGRADAATESSPVRRASTSPRWRIPAGCSSTRLVCFDCGAWLADAEVVDAEVRQIVDYLKIHLCVSEYLLKKISSFWRTLAGASAYRAIRRYVSTIRNHAGSSSAGYASCSSTTPGCPSFIWTHRCDLWSASSTMHSAPLGATSSRGVEHG